MKKLIYIIYFLLAAHLNGQYRKTIYVDEGYKKITKFEFQKKKDSKLYYSLSYNLDTAIVKRVLLRYYLGKLNHSKKHQLFSLLKARNGIDTLKSIHIHYLDTLKKINSYSDKDSILVLDNGSHKHLISHDTFLKAHEYCEKTHSGENIKMYHFYNFNEGHPEEIGKLKWHKDNLQLIRRLFYNGSDNTRRWTIIIHPNGDYAIKNAAISSSKLWKKLKKHKNWDTHLKKFNKDYDKLNPELERLQ